MRMCYIIHRKDGRLLNKRLRLRLRLRKTGSKLNVQSWSKIGARLPLDYRGHKSSAGYSLSVEMYASVFSSRSSVSLT